MYTLRVWTSPRLWVDTLLSIYPPDCVRFAHLVWGYWECASPRHWIVRSPFLVHGSGIRLQGAALVAVRQSVQIDSFLKLLKLHSLRSLSLGLSRVSRGTVCNPPSAYLAALILREPLCPKVGVGFIPIRQAKDASVAKCRGGGYPHPPRTRPICLP